MILPFRFQIVRPAHADIPIGDPAVVASSVEDAPMQPSAADAPPATAPVAAPVATPQAARPAAPAPSAPAAQPALPPESVPLDRETVLRMRLDETQQQLVSQQIGSARQDARERAYRYVYRELGVESLEDARALVAQARTLNSAATERARNLETEMERLRLDAEARVTQVRQETTSAQAERDQHIRLASEALRVAAVRVAAIQANFRDPDDAVRYLDLQAFPVSLSDRSVGGVAEAVQALAQERTYLLNTPAPAVEPVPAESAPVPASPPAPVPAQTPVPPPVVPATPTAPPQDTTADQETALAALRRDVRSFF